MKYSNRKVIYKGEKYDSEKELQFFQQYIEHSGKKYDVHRRYQLFNKPPVGGRNMRSRFYTPDFVVFDEQGNLAHVYDVKTSISKYAVTEGARWRFYVFAVKYGIPVEVVAPRAHDFKMKIFDLTTQVQSKHSRTGRNGKKTNEYYDVFSSIDYDVHDIIGE